MKKVLFVLAFAAVPLFFASCDKESGSGPGTGTMTLSITDSPIDSGNVTGVFITISDIQVNTSDSGWLTIKDFKGPETYNLMDLTRGETDLLGSITLDGGQYNQIRFMLDAPEKGTDKPVNPGCYIQFADGNTEPLFVPSGSQSGFKGIGSFTVPVNGTVDVTADFDVRKSITKTGSPSPRYILRPTIRLVVNNQAGQIRGNVTNIPADTAIVVYSYADGTYTNDESNDPSVTGSTRFPNAISSDIVDSLGIYHIAFLAAGKYDLVVTSLVNGSFGEVLGKIEDVTVESGRTTKQDIDISTFK
ncbi:MAG TPA: DUF4382 domain-containing protein [Bacteroidales bacterium]|nr:DUF4382 domain-containing protein [Bacteroidales bacterium]HPT21859.1 DUF4382 domain-containing protein [Bacteroidales bacterium]